MVLIDHNFSFNKNRMMGDYQVHYFDRLGVQPKSPN
jgi:hypothetical protein